MQQSSGKVTIRSFIGSLSGSILLYCLDWSWQEGPGLVAPAPAPTTTGATTTAIAPAASALAVAALVTVVVTATAAATEVGLVVVLVLLLLLLLLFLDGVDDLVGDAEVLDLCGLAAVTHESLGDVEWRGDARCCLLRRLRVCA